MSAFSLSGVLIAVSSFGLGLFVFLKSGNRRIGRIWFLFSLSVTLWGIGSAWIGTTHTPTAGLLACRASYVPGVVLIAPFFFHFVTAFLDQSRPRLIAFNYIIALIFISLAPTRFFFPEARIMFHRFGYAIAGPVFPFFFVWWMCLVVLSHIQLARSMRSVSAEKKNQIRYFFLAIAVGFTGGSLCYLPNFGIEIYPWGNFTVPLYPIIMAYAILRFNLMDVRVFVRRAIVLLAVYLCLIAIALPLFVLTSQTRESASQVALAAEILGLSVLFSLGPIVYAYLLRNSYWLRGHATTGLTHELKSPLVAIQSATEILLDQARGGSSDGQKTVDYLEMIRKNATRLDGVVRDLLHVAKTDSDRMEFAKRPFDLAPLISAVIEQHRFNAESKGLPITMQSAGPLNVIGDAEKIRQTLSNLMSNAIKFSQSGAIHVQTSQHAADVRVTVSDQGRGIPKKHLSRVFDRFFQVDQGCKGTGIGLAIAKAWVEAHGGRIWAESDGEGKGTTVTFTLPAGL